MFPYNAHNMVVNNVADPEGDLRYNLAEVNSQGVDISAMEVDSSSTATVASHASNTVTSSIEDGGAGGTGTTDLDTTVGGANTAWTALTPKAHTMSTSGSDLDVDDWINASYDENGTVAPGAVGMHANYCFGIPGSIS